jgi:putative ABC transport system permease protein
MPQGERAQALFRGVTPGVLRVHPEVRITTGNFPATGEVIAGGLAWRKLGVTPETLKPGAVITVDGRKLRLAGTFAAPGTVMESEFWMPLGDLRVLAKRDTLSCVVLRMRDPADVAEAGVFAKQRLDLELSALRESDYYSRLSAFFRPLRVMTWITAGLIAAGALFGGINTLYSAFASRVREMATLQAIGYSRGALLISLVQETTLASLAGTLTACVVAKCFFDGLELPFSIGVFTLEIGPAAALGALLSGLFLGLVGALPPAYRCLKPALAAALRS